MSKTKKSSKTPDLEKNLQTTPPSTTSYYSEAEIPYISEIPNKIKFLRKIGFVFFYYYLLLALITILIFFDLRKAREISRIFYLQKFFWIFLTFSILIKFSVAILPGFKNFQRFFFSLDLIFTFFFITGFYFFLEEYQRQYSIAHGFYLILTIWVLFSINIVFLLTTIIKSRRIYNPLYGIATMILMSFVVLLILGNVFQESTSESKRYFLIILPISVFSAYFCVNSFMVVNYRTKKYKVDDHYFAFFCFFIDFFFVFWKDLVMNMKFVKKIKKKRKLNKKNQNLEISNFEKEQENNKIKVLKKSARKSRPKKSKLKKKKGKSKKLAQVKEFRNE